MNEVTGTKMIPAPFSREIFDQTALLNQVDVITSTRMMKVLRTLRKHGPIGEGELAMKVGERMYYPEWKHYITLLLQWEWIKEESRCHGHARKLSLDKQGEEFLAARLDPRPAPVEE
jgi:hypothetical protein